MDGGGVARESASVGLALLRAMRPLNWLKNLLVFVPVLTAHRLDAGALGAAGLVFVGFSLAASSVYLANDILDREADRRHPRKRHRSIASGSLPLPMAGMAAAALGIGALGLGWLGDVEIWVLAYLAVSTGYSLGLKRLRGLDLLLLSGLHLMRIGAGGAAAEIAISGWLLGFSAVLFLALAAAKRLGELMVLREGEAAPGRGYAGRDRLWVGPLAVGAAVCAVAVLAGYAASGQVAALYARPWLVALAVPLMALWLGRLLWQARRGRMGDDPLVFAATDPASLAFTAALLAVMALAV